MSGEIGRDLTVAASREHEQLALFDLDEPSVVQLKLLEEWDRWFRTLPARPWAREDLRA